MRWRPRAGAVVVSAAALVGGLVGGLLGGPTAGGAPVAAASSPSVVVSAPATSAPVGEPASTPTAPTSTTPVAPALTESSGRLMVPSVGLDVAIVETVTPVNGVVRPATRTGAAWVVGLAPDQVAHVLALHSSVSVGAPGNVLSTVDGASTVQPGDQVDADGTTYVVESAQVVDKGGDASAVVGDRLDEDVLVIVTCRPTSSSPGRSPVNVVVVAIPQAK